MSVSRCYLFLHIWCKIPLIIPCSTFLVVRIFLWPSSYPPLHQSTLSLIPLPASCSCSAPCWCSSPAQRERSSSSTGHNSHLFPFPVSRTLVHAVLQAGNLFLQLGVLEVSWSWKMWSTNFHLFLRHNFALGDGASVLSVLGREIFCLLVRMWNLR